MHAKKNKAKKDGNAEKEKITAEVSRKYFRQSSVKCSKRGLYLMNLTWVLTEHYPTGMNG